ncbi:hypothetical protein WMF37_11245 [Sorangium sp. So ce291]|uniref:hypothetical protein n=1 Tax=Sorangium sp. So ce291 TaxID=3133294 RepID=UPI003F604D17
MRWPVFALGVVSSFACPGCSPDPPSVAGSVTVVLDGEELTIDTGDGGKRPVIGTDDPVSGICTLGAGYLGMWVQHHTAKFGTLDMGDEPGHPHVTAEIAGTAYQGECPIAIEVQRKEPYEADVSAGPCELFRPFDGAVLRLESASFHLTGCWDD